MSLESSPECVKALSDPEIHDSGEGDASLTDGTDELELPGCILIRRVREMAVHHRVRSKRPEKIDSYRGPDEGRASVLPDPTTSRAPLTVVTRTLCLKTPVRSKKGKEVMGAVDSQRIKTLLQT